MSQNIYKQKRRWFEVDRWAQVLRDSATAAYAATKAAANALSQDPTERADDLNHRAIELSRHFQTTDSIDDLNKAIDIIKEAIELTPNSNGNFKNTLGGLLLFRFERTRCKADINGAIEAFNDAVEKLSCGSDRSMAMTNLSGALEQRFESTGDIHDLEAAIQSNRDADLSELPPATQATIFHNLGIALIRRFERKGCIDDINEAVQVLSRTSELNSESRELKGYCLSALGAAFITRFQQTGSGNDINPAIKAHEESLGYTPETDPNRMVRLNNFSLALLRRFELTSSMDDINGAVTASVEAVKLCPEDHPDRGLLLNTLGTVLRNRFERTASMADINSAVAASEMGVKSSPPNHPNYPFYLSNLSGTLSRRFERTQAMEDINEAVSVAEKACKSIPKTHPNLAMMLSNYGGTLQVRFGANSSSEDLDTAIDQYQKSVSIGVPSHPYHATHLYNLGSALQSRYKQALSIDDLNAAIEAHQKAVALAQANHPLRGSFLNGLGHDFKQRFERSKSMEDLNSAIDAFTESVRMEASAPNVRINSAVCASDLLFTNDIKRASDILAIAVDLLPMTSPRTLSRTDQQFALSRSGFGLAADAAALSVQAGYEPFHSLRLLEVGRGVMAGLHFDARSDINELRYAHPDLAEKFLRLRNVLDSPNVEQPSPFDTAISIESMFLRRYEASKEFRELIELIQKQDGFERFLTVPSESEMKSLAIAGPIVFINVSRFGCCAFLVKPYEITHLELPTLSFTEVVSHADELLTALQEDNPINRRFTNPRLRNIVEWLWDVVVEAILQELGFTSTPEGNTPWPHVWWVPVGLASLFPIHAAGYHHISGRSVLDRVITSYTPTAKALNHARIQIKKRNSSDKVQSVLIVVMPTTPQRGELRYADEECQVVEQIVPAPIKRIILRTPTKAEVEAVIGNCSITHFVCHGEVNSDSSKSCILFKDWQVEPFSVADMARRNIDDAEFAYISACHTAANSEGLELVDESIHMANACQLAGFPTVIGTLWQCSDDCVSVAADVYRAMSTPDKLDVRKAAQGLHFAIRSLRDQSKEDNSDEGDFMAWTPYVHVGA